MRKITLFLSLCLAFIGITGTAQTPTTSDAPTNGNWAENTTWYLIQNGKGGYVSPASGYADNSGMKLTNSAKVLNDDLLWCIVADDNGGYKFYNKGAGIDKFMGMTGSEDNARMKMYTAAEVTGDVTTTFDFGTSGYETGNISIRLHGSANNYWNRRGDYLALWNSTGATGNDSGSAFKFISAIDELIVMIQVVIDSDEEAIYFKLTESDLSTLKNVVTALTAGNMTYDQGRAKYDEILQNGNRTNTEIADGTKVIFGNLLHTDRYIGIKSGTTDKLGSPTTMDWSTVWTLKRTDEGLFKFYNEYVDKYIGAIPTENNQPFTLVDTEGEATAYTISASTMPGYCRIADLTFSNASLQNFHMVNWDGVVRWGASTEASQFKFIEFTSQKAQAWSDALLEYVKTGIGDRIGYKLETPELSAAISALEGNKTSMSIYLNLETIWEGLSPIYPKENQFYTIRGATQTTKYMTEKYGELIGEKTAVYGEEQAENIVPTLWYFERCTDGENTDLCYIKSVNSDLCLRKAEWGQSLRMVELDDEAVGKYDFSHRAARNVANAVTLVTYTNEQRSDRATANLGSNGTIQSWNPASDGNNWFIEEVTDIPVSIGSTGYATLNLPFAVTIAKDVKAHTAEDAGAEITLTEIQGGVIPANTPVILTGNADTYNFAIAYDNKDAALTTVLSGTTVPETIAEGAEAYILKNGTKGIGMYLVDSEDDRTIPANKAYLGSTQATVDVKRFAIAGEATGIEGVTTNDAAADIYYDLNGRRVLYPAHGVYVKSNGQKVFIK